MKTILVDAVYCFVIEAESGNFEIFEDMHEMLEMFPNRKILLTGADDAQFRGFGLDAMPYEVFTLKHDPEKTDPEYFRALLAHFNLKSDDVVYFEHSLPAVESAASVGIVSYHYDNAARDLGALKEFLAKNL